jgi:predicted O-methyltransferase YrrM
MKKLDEIAIEVNTDESSKVHNYCNKYEKWLPFNRIDEITILEIGVQTGSSLLLWKEFYPNSTVVGIDIDQRCKLHEDPEKKIFVGIGSQIDLDFLSAICEKWGTFDMILDDGSHINSQVIASFNKLFHSVKPGGVYIVEDCCTSYWEDDGFGGGFRKPESMVEFFKNLVDDVNFNGELHEDPDLFVYARKEEPLMKKVREKEMKIRTDIESINFMNSIIIVTKNNFSNGA